MSQPLENVREQLLRAGIAPGHVRRYVAELREHLADLAARERASGLDAARAEERATALLGSDAQLVQAMIDSGAPRSLAARAPWSVFAVMPVVLLVAATSVTAFSMMHLLWAVRGVAPADLPAGYATLIATVSFVTSYLVGPLLVVACIAIALRQRLVSSWVWVGLALIALISGPLGFHMHFIASAGGDKGSTIFSAFGIVYQHGRADLAASLVVAAVRAALLFAVSAVAYRALQRRLIPAAAQIQ